MRQAVISIKTAKELYKQGGSARKLALDNFSEEDLKEPDWPKCWEELDVSGFYPIGLKECWDEHYGDTLIVPTLSQAKSMRAFAMLSQLAAEMNGEVGWEDWDDLEQEKWAVVEEKGDLCVVVAIWNNKRIHFKTEQMAGFSRKHHRDLWEEYWMIK